MLSLVEGIQQLETYFGQYLPQLFVAVLTPVLIFGFVVFLDWPVALVMLAAAIGVLLAPALWHRWDSQASLARNRAYAAFGADFLDAVQGLATLKAFGQSGERGRRLEERARACDLVLTGEGAFDFSSRAGKVPYGVASIAADALRPCVALAGQVLVGAREMRALGIESAYSLFETVGEERAFAEPGASLADLAARVARTWSV